jgi:hypothetical protein
MLERGAKLAEEHDISGILDLTTEDFRAYPDELDHRGAKRVLWMAFRHYGNLKVIHPQPIVDLQGDGLRAHAAVPFLVVKKQQALPNLKDLYGDPAAWLEEVGESADLYRFKLDLIKDDAKWVVRRARLEKFSGLGFKE